MPLIDRLPTLTQLRHLVAVADHGHFTRAAEACLVTQSSVSASIKELENLLGATLLERTKRTVRLTPLGEEITDRSRRLIRDAGDIVDVARHAGEPLSGRLRLGVIPTIAPFLLPRVLPALRKPWPDLQLYLKEDKSANLISALNDGQLDLLALAFPFDTGTLETHLFADDPFWLAFPRGHAFSGQEIITLKELSSEKLLLLEEGNCLSDHIKQVSPRLTPDEYQASSLYTLVQMVEGGLGLTLLPKMAIDAGLIRGTRIEVRPLAARTSSRKIGFAWRPSSPGRHDFELLADFFEAELGTPLPKHRRT